MLEKSFSLLFYIKRQKNYSKGPVPIYMRITVNGCRTELSTGRTIEPDRWNAPTNRGNGNKEEIKSLNAFLDTLQVKVFEARRKAVESNATITSSLLRDILKGQEDKPRMLLEMFEKHNKQVEALVGSEFARGTHIRYQTAMDHIKNFLIHKSGTSDIDIRKLDYEFISEYCFWLKSVRKCNHNTALKYISNFRKIVNIALSNGWLLKDPFLGFKMHQKEVIRKVLSKEDLQKIYDKEIALERLDQVRDIFLFSCYTGLSYADVRKLKRTEIVKGIDGEQWIFTSRQKTETASRIPLLPITLRILDKYKNHPQCTEHNKVLPVSSNQKMNAYLKEIADLCKINNSLTFHIARHTFATTVTMSNGVPIESISKMLGHKNIRTTQHYAKILDRKVSDDMLLLKSKLVSLF